MSPNQKIAAVVITVALLCVVYLGTGVGAVYFEGITTDDIVAIMTPLFIIATFLERAQEVFVKAWRQPRRDVLDSALKRRSEALKHLQDVEDRRKHGLGPATPQELAAYEDDRNKAEDELLGYRSQTQRIAFLFGLSFGVVLAALGMRTLTQLTDVELLDAGAQKSCFIAADILLTGGLLGGGSEGIHRLVKVITDFLDETRKGMKKNSAAANSQ